MSLEKDMAALLEKRGDKPITYRTLVKFLDKLTDVVFDVMKTHKAHIQALETKHEARIAALEARPELKWAGIHVQGAPYSEGNLVTRSGSLWLAMSETSATPGKADSGWRMILKNGADLR